MTGKSTYEELEQRIRGLEKECDQFRLKEDSPSEDELRFRTVFEMAPLGVVVVGPDFRYMDVNKAFAEFVGYSRKELLSMNTMNITYPEDKAGHVRLAEKARRGEVDTYNLERRFIRKDGEIRWGRITSTAFLAVGKEKCRLEIIEDITERRRVEAALGERERHLQSILDNVPACVFHKDCENRLLNANRAWLDTFDLKPEEIVGRKLSELIPPSIAEAFYQDDLEVIHTGQPKINIEEEIQTRRGTRWFITHKIPSRNAYNQIDGIIGFALDITERKRVEQDLRESEAQIAKTSQIMAAVLEHTHMMAVLLDRHFNFIWVNRAYAKTCRRETSFFPGKNHFDLYPHEENRAIFQRVIDSGEPFFATAKPFEFRDQPERGVTYWDWSLIPVKDAAGTVSNLVLTLAEVTERIRAERALRESERLLERTFVCLHDAVFIVGADPPEILDCNPAASSIFGYSRDEMLGKTTAILHVDETSRQDFRAMLYPAVEEKGFLFLPEFSMKRKDGTVFPTEHKAMPLEDENGQRVGWVSMVRDATDRKKAEEELRQKTGLNQTLLDALPCVALLMRTKTREIVAMNRAARDAGCILGRTCFETWPKFEAPCPWCLAPEAWKSGKAHRVEVEGLNTVWDAHWSPISEDLYLHYAFDVAERKKTEARLQQAQKLEAIGTLAGGIAHDFNNILGVITGCTELTLMEMKKGSRHWENLNEAFKAAERAKDLVKQILTFSRQSESDEERRPVRVDLVVREALKFLRSSLPSTIEIEQKIGKRAGVVMGDPTQIHQVIMNLCVNAGHAMREREGILGVEVCDTEVSPEDAVKSGLASSGLHCLLRVSDTGHGMDAATLARIFDPYFTTKRPGEGTGLGLAVVHGIVKSHGGAVTVKSEIGRGTIFEVLLPEIVKSTQIQSPIEEDLPLGKGERILLVDDEPGLAHAHRGMLERLGYKVEVMTSSVDAYRAFSANPGMYDLLLTDMTMPHMTGADLSRCVLEIRPDMPIVLCTGFSERINEDKAREQGIRGLLMKPIARKDMAEAIRKALHPTAV